VVAAANAVALKNLLYESDCDFSLMTLDQAQDMPHSAGGSLQVRVQDRLHLSQLLHFLGA